jgi:hypothetical protein
MQNPVVAQGWAEECLQAGIEIEVDGRAPRSREGGNGSGLIARA